MKIAAIFFSTAFLAACSPAPLTDAQVQAVAEICKANGKELYIFSGTTTFAECRPKSK